MGQIFLNAEGKGVDATNNQNIGMCTAGKSNFGCVNSTDPVYLPANAIQPSENFQYVKMNKNNNWQTMYPGLTERCAQRNGQQQWELHGMV